jgi:glucokinase
VLSGEALAVDIGGTKLAAALLDRSGQVAWSAAAPTPPGAGAEKIWEAVETLVRQAPHARAKVCGVGCGGPMEPGGERVSPLNIPGWRDFPLRSRLADLTRLPTWVDNDAKALALGEGWVGSAVGCANYVSLVVSTGVGGGIVLDGRLLDGRSGNAGHIGHVTVVPEGRLCECGAHGCLEAEASGTAIAAITGRPPAEASSEIVERTGRLVGRAVGGVANLLDLSLATMAGSVALGFGAPFVAAAQQEVEATARLSFSRSCRIEVSRLGSTGPLIGAAAVALVRRPDLWPAALRLAPPKWWRRWPPLPIPPADYLRFRIETMYGSAGELDGHDLVRYLEWCRRVGHPAR